VRILTLISDVPNPPVSGSRARNFYLWPAIRELGHEVKVVGLNAFHTGWSNYQEAADNNEGEYFRPDRPSPAIRALRTLIRSHYERARSLKLAARVDALCGSWAPDVISAEELRMGFYLPGFRGRSYAGLQSVTLHNIESRLYRRLRGRGLVSALHHSVQMRSLEGYERDVIKCADVVFAYSPTDYCYFRRQYPSANWRQTRNGADARGIAVTPQNVHPQVLFVGTLSYAPNVQGLRWLIEEVWPHLKTSVCLTVAGSGANATVREMLGRASVRFIDTPRDLTPLYRETAMSVVPILEGGGSRGKIIEACAHGRMVVTTSRGLEGLDLRPGEEGVVVADDARDFARVIKYWCNAVSERSELAAKGRDAVRARYDWSVVAKDLVDQWSASRSSR
jgi:glycosyltransferase involved in cell wall biosynthesis